MNKSISDLPRLSYGFSGHLLVARPRTAAVVADMVPLGPPFPCRCF